MKSIKISTISFLIGVLLLQFYVFRSGVLQPSHAFILISFLIILFTFGIPKTIIYNKSYFNFIVFVILTLLINIFYSILHKDIDFIISSTYYIYGLVILCITILLLNFNPNFANLLANVLFISLLSTILLWIFGFGKYDFFPRYNAYFNDPNQMAHWSLCIAASVILLTKSNWIKYFTILVTFIIIIISMSRSGLAGLAFLLLGIFIPNNKNVLFIFISILIITTTVTLTSFKKTIFFENYENVIDRFLETDFEEQADTRGYSRAQQYPEYLILGSGQGLDSRFHSDFEIHSSWMGLLFYYGFIVLILFLYILFNRIKYLNFDKILVVLGPFVYGFSTFGIRTPVFWLLMGILIYVTGENFKKNIIIGK
jgi:hypothetical protein